MFRSRRQLPFAVLLLTVFLAPATTAAQETLTRPILWGDEVPPGWSGEWPEALRTVPERTGFTRTMSTLQLHEWISALKWRSDKVHVVNLFTSPLGRVAPAIVLSNPRVTSAQQARESGKPVIFLQGNIHPPEPEAAEAMLMAIRDILFGGKQHLLDTQIIVIAPIFNVDGTDAFTSQDGGLGSATPHVLGVRPNSQGLDLNRDAVKLETVEMNGLYRFFNAWDPVLYFDGHLMSRVTHGYANNYATSTVPAAHPAPRGWVTDSLFPAVRERVRDEFALEVFTHALPDRQFPPTVWHHDNAAWTVEAKFVINAYGLRNRMGIITETPGHPAFERRIYSQYAYILALLEFTGENGARMQDIASAADEATVAAVLAGAEAGTLRNWLDGEYRSRGEIEILMYPENREQYIPGTSVRGTRPGDARGPPQTVRVQDMTLPVGTRDAPVPRGYILPAELAFVVEKLRTHNIRVEALDAPRRVEGEVFDIAGVRSVNSRGYLMTTLDGAFRPVAAREFPAGSFFVDMAQPMANAAFYYLEPQARDGFVGWGVLDGVLAEIGAAGGGVEYPIFKYRREVR